MFSRIWRRHLTLPFTATVLLVLYVTAYSILSRLGYAEARNSNMDGFYYVSPFTAPTWFWLNSFFRVAFCPLNMLDCLIGEGMPPAYDPLMSLS